MTNLNKDQIKNLLPHREPMLLIDELRNIKNLKLTNKIKNAKIFIAYYINKVRLIDNF